MARRRRSVVVRGSGLSLMDQIQNEGSVHNEAVARVEAITKRNLICYTAFLQHPAGSILVARSGGINVAVQRLAV